MSIDTNGAMKRPKLSLAYAGRRADSSAPHSPLPVTELRRIVAAMIG